MEWTEQGVDRLALLSEQGRTERGLDRAGGAGSRRSLTLRVDW